MLRLLDLKVRGRPLQTYTRVQSAYAGFVRNKPWQYNGIPDTKKYLNVGCGENVHADFVNLEWHWWPGVDLCVDITKGIHFPNARFEGIFTEHCLEHITYDQCRAVLMDFHRLLKPGGIARIIVPDGGHYLDLYQKWKAGDRTPFPYLAAAGAADLQDDSRYGFTPMMAVNRIFRGYEHKFAYDYETLERLAASAGFSRIRHVSFGVGSNPALLIDSQMRAPQSLYVECTKGDAQVAR